MATFTFRTEVTGASGRANARKTAEGMVDREFKGTPTRSISSEKVEPGVYDITVTAEYPTLWFADDALLKDAINDDLPSHVSVSGVNAKDSYVRVGVYIQFTSEGDQEIQGGVDMETVPASLRDQLVTIDSQVLSDAEAAADDIGASAPDRANIEQLDDDLFEALTFLNYDGDSPLVEGVCSKSIEQFEPSSDWDSYSAEV